MTKSYFETQDKRIKIFVNRAGGDIGSRQELPVGRQYQ